MSLVKKQEGKLGEDIAVEFLQKKGFKIVERNFLMRGGEIDIVAIDASDGSEVLAFIEVKTRKSVQFGSPLEAISYWKLKSLVKAAQFYKLKYRNLPELMRIDAVSVVLHHDNSIASIELVKNIS